jgi:hypothetical protein
MRSADRSNGFTAGLPVLATLLAAVTVSFLAAQTALADPMKCSGEEKTCIANCVKVARSAVSTCVTDCGARKSYCVKTGCWDNGRQRYCGLSKQ